MTPTPVGMRCPECARDRTKVKTIRSRTSVPTVTEILIAINVIVFFAETATGAPLGGGGGGTIFDKGFLLGPYIAQNHEYWRLVTAGFLHDGLLHIVFNMFFLFVMGRMLEPAIGSVKFAAVYFASLLAGSGDSALEVVIVLSIVVPLTVLAVVCWIFWRAARRVDATGAPLHEDRRPRP